MSRKISTADVTDINEFMYNQDFSDGLPLVPPTAERVAAMLTGTLRDPAQVLGKCPPNFGVVTVEKVAINAVMAGCSPKHLRIVLAAVECMLDPKFGLHGSSATTMGATPAVLVSGPCRDECGINYQHGALGSGHRANATIGRAVKLVLHNLGGARLGGTESTTLGTPMKFTLCVAEHESRAPEWTPYHVERGFSETDSVVTLLSVTSGPHQVVDFYTKDADALCALLAKSMHGLYNAYFPWINDCLLVISPEHYDTLVRGGITSKEQLRQRLWGLCNKDFAPSIRTLLETQKGKLVGSLVGYPLGWLARALNFVTGKGFPLLSKFTSPDSFHVLVAGGPAGKFSSFCPGFGIGKSGPSSGMSKAVSRKIDAAVFSEADLSLLETKEADFILDPTAEAEVTPFQLAKRSGSIHGKIALEDISKPGGKVLLDRIQTLLQEKFPDIECIRYVKPTFSKPMPDQQRAQIAKECTFVVAALAD